jgi:secreted PhoX family phosphatase
MVFPGYNGTKIKKYQNFNWMVEIDPRTAKAVRKQYNWGRQGFEGGAVLPDNKTVILGEDGDAGASLLTKFVADTPGDFTKGKTYIFKQKDNSFQGDWIEVPQDINTMLDIHTWAKQNNATGFYTYRMGYI